MWSKFEVVDDYMSQMKSEDWKILLEKKRFDFRNDKRLYEWVQMSVHLGLADMDK